MQELERLIAETIGAYGADPTAPSIVLSHVEGKGFYGSIVRYSDSFARGKSVAHKTFAPTVAGVVDTLLRELTKR